MGREKFKPHTLVHESWNMNNSGDVYNAICRMAQTGGNQALVGKHIGLNFPGQMECVLFLEHNGRPLTFNITPVMDETRYIIDGLGYDMRCPDVVLTASDRYGYVTAYTISSGPSRSTSTTWSPCSSQSLKITRRIPVPGTRGCSRDTRG